MVALRTIVFVVLFMGTVLLYVPYLLVSGPEGAARLTLGLWRFAGALALLLGLGALGASAQALRAQVPVPQPAEPLPQGDVFRPLIADPKQPHFFASWLWTKSPLLTSQVASVGLGEDIGIIRGRGGRWQVSVAAGVFSQFNMETKSNDLINTDFVIGFPLTYQRGPWSARARIYHQSSHLGDEFILNNNPTRVNLSFEALELLASRDFGAFRVYGGGEYLFRHEPAALRPGLLHWGAEGRLPGTVVRLGGLGGGRLIVALDAKSSQERKWQTGWSARAGLEFIPAGASPEARRRLSVQLQAYDGPAPYGQFYLDNVRSVGVGVHFSL